MAKKVSSDTPVAWLNADHDSAKDGAGYYEVLKDNEHEMQPVREGAKKKIAVFTNTEVKYGKKVVWVKNKADEEGKPNPKNNEGHFVYDEGSDNE